MRASGLAFPPDLLPRAEIERRILARWAPGACVLDAGGTLALRLSEPVPLRAETAPGIPLVSLGGVLFSAPLGRDEREALSPATGSMVLVSGGETNVIADLASVDPGAWLDLSTFELERVSSLGARPAAATPTLETPAVDPRRRLLGERDAPRERQELLESLARRAPGRTSPIGLLRSALLALQRGGPRGDAGPPSHWIVRLRILVARILAISRLSRFLSARQAEYLARLMDMLDSGDTLEALRHAIPLSSLPGGPDAGPHLGGLSARGNLSFSLSGGAGARTAIALSAQLFGDLRARYRAIYERLAGQGKVEEAAFVLVELLEAYDEAVSYLERNGRLELAAQLAEGRCLPAGLVVRQWFLAGNVTRAVRLARRHGAFLEAVSRLESSRPEDAAALRLLWAESLAAAGDAAGAVEVAWKLPGGRPAVARWIGLGLALGGPPAARLLARKLSILPRAYGEVRAAALRLLTDDTAEEQPSRLAFARALLQAPRASGVSTLARVAARALIRDAPISPEPLVEDARKLARISGDRTLEIDLPRFSSAPAARLPIGLAIAARDVGVTPIGDAALLPSGRLLVALGEAGTRLLARDGRTLAAFDVPAHELVLADHGGSAIALARRGEVWRLSRIDLAARRAAHWFDALLSAVAPDFDGSMWFAASRDELLAIDATATRLESLWQVSGLGHAITRIARSPTRCRVLTTGPGPSRQEWVYELPSLTLRRRQEAALDLANAVAFSPDLEITASTLSGSFHVRTSAGLLALSVEGPEPHPLRLRGHVLTLADSRGRVVAVDARDGKVLLNLRL